MPGRRLQVCTSQLGWTPPESQACSSSACVTAVDCSGHGNCAAAQGLCACNAGWTGLHCSVATLNCTAGQPGCCAGGVTDESGACCASGAMPDDYRRTLQHGIASASMLYTACHAPSRAQLPDYIRCHAWQGEPGHEGLRSQRAASPCAQTYCIHPITSAQGWSAAMASAVWRGATADRRSWTATARAAARASTPAARAAAIRLWSTSLAGGGL